MSNTRRLFGIEFAPIQMNATHPLGKDKTGYEYGQSVGFPQSHEIILTEGRFLEALGISRGSDADYDLSDLVRYGDIGIMQFIHDFVAGYDNARNQRMAANDALGQFNCCAKYLMKHRQEAVINAGEHLDEILGENNFPVCEINGFISTDSEPVMTVKEFFAAEVVVKDGELVQNNEGALILRFHPQMVYNESTCRAITKLFNEINSSLFEIMEEVMEEEARLHVVSLIRGAVKDAADGYGTSGIPNYYLTK